MKISKTTIRKTAMEIREEVLDDVLAHGFVGLVARGLREALLREAEEMNSEILCENAEESEWAFAPEPAPDGSPLAEELGKFHALLPDLCPTTRDLILIRRATRLVSLTRRAPARVPGEFRRSVVGDCEYLMDGIDALRGRAGGDWPRVRAELAAALAAAGGEVELVDGDRAFGVRYVGEDRDLGCAVVVDLGKLRKLVRRLEAEDKAKGRIAGHYGQVLITKGRHKGKKGYYDDDDWDEMQKAIVYLGAPFFSPCVLLDYSAIEECEDEATTTNMINSNPEWASRLDVRSRNDEGGGGPDGVH